MRRPSLACSLLVAVSACSSKSTTATPPAPDPLGDGPAPTPAGIAAACKGDLAADGAALAFVDASAAWELDKAHLYVVGNHLEAVDLDGDGYPDLLVHSGAQARSDPSQPGNKQLTRVLMNRAKPGGGRRFVDATVDSNYGAVRPDATPANGLLRMEHLAVAADVDNDGDLDLFSGTYTDPTVDRTKTPDTGDRDEVLLNDGKGHFTLAQKSDPQTVSASLQPTTSAAFTDVDHDGIVDVWVGAWYKHYGQSYLGVQARLFKGKGDGTFVDATPGSGLETQNAGYAQGLNHRPLYGVTACDLDGDGLPELLGSAYGRQWNLLYRNLGAQSGAPSFAEIGQPSGYAGDDDLDYQDNQFYECWCKTTGNCVPQSPPVISPCDATSWDPSVDSKPWRLNGNTFTTVCADLNGDGKLDLYSAEIAHWHIGQSSDKSELLANDGPTSDAPIHFTRPGRPATGLDWKHVTSDWNEGGIMVAAADLDLDGLEDLVVGASDYPDNYSLVYRQKADAPGTFEEVGEAIGLHHACTNGLAIADFDRDGDLDVVVGSSLARDCAALYPDGNQVFFFENKLNDQQGRGYVQVALSGKPSASNRTGVGARVRVAAGGRVLTQELSGGYGHFGQQHDTVLTFGLGGACKVDEIEIRWPDAQGTLERYSDLGGGQRVLFTQGGGVKIAPPSGS